MQERGDGDGGMERGAGLVVAGGHRAALLEPVEATFHDVAVPVDQLVEGRWAAAARSAIAAVFLLVRAFGDGVSDAAAA